jgi:hypothetical protein
VHLSEAISCLPVPKQQLLNESAQTLGAVLLINVKRTRTRFLRLVRINNEKRLIGASCLSVRICQHGSHWTDFREI